MQDLNDKVDGGSLSAAEWNQLPSEVQNVIEGLGQTLSGGDINQLGKAIAGYVANGDFYTDSGIANAYVLSQVGIKQSPPAIANGMCIRFYAGNTNTGASTVNPGGLGVTDLRNYDDTVLAPGMIVAGKLYEAVYSSSAGWFRLQGTTAPVAPEIHGITASVATNALTINILPQYVEFRSTTLTNGAPIKREIGATISMVVSSGSTLGTLNGIAARLLVIAIDNAGTVEVAVVNMAGGVNLDDSGLITTVAEGGAGGADSATTVYSTTGRANVAYRIMGYIDITEATAGTWATAPTKVQGAGGQVLGAMNTLGNGQTWQDLTGSRAKDVTYYNTTGRPIEVHIRQAGTNAATSITINGVTITGSAVGNSLITTMVVGPITVPAGASYICASAGTINAWHEMR